jgi:hypothetical protein
MMLAAVVLDPGMPVRIEVKLSPVLLDATRLVRKMMPK